ncbi:hypothetical protein M8C21_028797 [Ambrosia artemisiifolia]|uniref:Uncharacterized protein n=1 Tax=Ambrosia artemisiifolia TaxID=4212 RepID=A0AAD5GDB7_AMBAR|nr:hypothetical protein M8C21_028797 [Ambrosia artemisiifolia]
MVCLITVLNNQILFRTSSPPPLWSILLSKLLQN